MANLAPNEVSITEPSHAVPFIMDVDQEGFVDVPEKLLCLHFNLEHSDWLLLERQEFDDDHVHMRSIYQKPRYHGPEIFYRVVPGHYKFQSLCAPGPLSQVSTMSPGTFSSYRRNNKSVCNLRTVVECSNMEVVSLSSDSELDPDSPARLDLVEVDGFKWLEYCNLNDSSVSMLKVEAIAQEDIPCRVECSKLEYTMPSTNVTINCISEDENEDQPSDEDPAGGCSTLPFALRTQLKVSGLTYNRSDPVTPVSHGLQSESNPIASETPSITSIKQEGEDSVKYPSCPPSSPVTFDSIGDDSQSKLASTPYVQTNEELPVGCTLQSSQILSDQPIPILDGNLTSSSIMEYLLAIGKQGNSRSIFKNTDLSLFDHKIVAHLPATYNGDLIFELPALPAIREGGACRLDGMDRRFDGHVWTETGTSNISDPSGILSFKYVKCLGHLRCPNLQCRCISETKNHNEKYWTGASADVLTPNVECVPSRKCNLLCKYCKTTPICLALCTCKMYYVVSKNPLMSRACVHFGVHTHPVAKGEDRGASILIQSEIQAQVERTPAAKGSAIALAVSRELLMKGLIDEKGEGKHLTSDELDLVLEKWSKLSSSSVNNMIADARQNMSGGGYVDSILQLKRKSTYDYIHDSCFPGQGSDLAYVFKMSTSGPGSGVALVKRMQRDGDLKDEWVMFDHVKRVDKWTTLGMHVYDPNYQKVMTICVCDMKSEMADHQKQMRRSLLAVMRKHGEEEVNFKGFMADSAQANFNGVREVFGSGDKSVPMKGKERTCQFHWAQALEKHTKKFVHVDYQAMHIRLCQEYRKCKTKSAADTAMEAIKAWWFASEAVSESGMKEMTAWIHFWHFRFEQWGSFVSEAPLFDELAVVPTCNLSEIVHNKWMQASGSKMVDLYHATVDDFSRSLQQSSFYFNYLRGGPSGTGPSKSVLQLRYATRTGNANSAIKVLNKVAIEAGVNTRVPHLEGETIFGTAKRKLDLPPRDDNDSHRHDRVNFTIPKVARWTSPAQASRIISASHIQVDEVVGMSAVDTPLNGGLSIDLSEISLPARKAASLRPYRRYTKAIKSGRSSSVAIPLTSSGLPVLESNVIQSVEWLIERISPLSNEQCRGKTNGKRCTAKIAAYSRPTTAPTFTGIEKQSRARDAQQVQFWFCPSRLQTCVMGQGWRGVVFYVAVPSIWPIKVGTNLTQSEVSVFEAAGFVLQDGVANEGPGHLFAPLSISSTGLKSEVAPFVVEDYKFSPGKVGLLPPLSGRCESVADGDRRPSSRDNRSIRFVAKPSVEHLQKMAANLNIECTLLEYVNVPPPRYGMVFTIVTPASAVRKECYKIVISNFPSCSCADFRFMKMKANRRQKWMPCKHLYFLLQRYFGCTEDDVFIHCAGWTPNEVKLLLGRATFFLKSED